jgi:SAM-dependent methyltransferase
VKSSSTVYILATGAQDVERLRLLNQVYGPASHAVLRRAGLAEGLRAAEVGCGTGNVTCWMARQVGPRGAVIGIDKNQRQIEQARRQAAEQRLTNVTFREGDAYAPGLPPESFDMAYCRLVLIHLKRPLEALRALRDLVRPGGRVVCEELDLGQWLCNPPARCMERFFELNLKLGERCGEDYRLGSALPRLFREAGFGAPEVTAHFPLVLRGENKRLLAMTFDEFAPALVREGLATPQEVKQIAQDMARVAADETTLLGLPLTVQVRAVK